MSCDDLAHPEEDPLFDGLRMLSLAHQPRLELVSGKLDSKSPANLNSLRQVLIDFIWFDSISEQQLQELIIVIEEDIYRVVRVLLVATDILDDFNLSLNLEAVT